ncbi:MAG: UDP-N-acetylmuramate dehydrogenase [Ardenticatenaceae bacterium]|nr:UDP-N-acetylmuramate dehydrogenase [Ardenticatenaceae bacterium]
MTLDLGYYHDVDARFIDRFGPQFQRNVPLAKYTSARVGGPANMLLTVHSAEELEAAVTLAYETGTRYFILGGGSNILVADQGVDGLVILNRARKVQFRHAGASIVCTAESGANLSSMARQCISKGLGGLEWAIGVPGTVGGAVVGNSGAHGSDMSDNLVAITIWEPGRGKRTMTVEELNYGYRDSILKREQGKHRPRRVVLTAELRFDLEQTQVLTARADAFTAKRKQSQPGGASTGSMFKNPENYYAGYLIEAAGLKGLRFGDAEISEKHANFFINHGQATAEEIRALVAEAWHVVRDRFGVEMDLEVELVGTWDFES